MPGPEEGFKRSDYARRRARIAQGPIEAEPGHLLLSSTAQQVIIFAREKNDLPLSLEERLSGRLIDPRDVLTEGELKLWDIVEASVASKHDAEQSEFAPANYLTAEANAHESIERRKYEQEQMRGQR
ncbi:MAG TPA: hypothetical protein VLG27_01100 [Candidatus Saccharimonadia bacterium]|nr:hypothetical protein [Candidatus Saccharimonadia bacterium]